MSVSMYHGKDGEEEIAKVIWTIMAKHYPGAVNPKNPSLMAQRLFAFSRAIYDDIEISLMADYDGLIERRNQEIEKLQAEIRELKGLPPLPPIAIA